MLLWSTKLTTTNDESVSFYLFEDLSSQTGLTVEQWRQAEVGSKHPQTYLHSPQLVCRTYQYHAESCPCTTTSHSQKHLVIVQLQTRCSDRLQTLYCHVTRSCRLWFWPIHSIIRKHDVVQKTRSTKCITLQSAEDRCTVTGNIQNILCNLEIGFLRYASKHTDRQTSDICFTVFENIHVII